MRHLLQHHWKFAPAPPNAIVDAAALADAPLAWLETTVPITAAAALAAQGRWSLDAPAQRFDAHDWWFRCEFDAPNNTPAPWILGFDGLATLAQVWLNGEEILASDNMFVAHECAVPSLRTRGNELAICCRALDAALALGRYHEQFPKWPRPRWRAPMVENQQLRWFRTTLLGRTPGWSPPAAAAGPWQSIWLESLESVRMARPRLATRISGSHAECSVSISMANTRASHCAFELSRDGRAHRVKLEPRPDGTWVGTLRIETPALWWPHTHGEPALYEATLELTGHGAAVTPVPLGAVGFRHIELEAGEDFGLRVNGERIFCRGACWTPLDVTTLHACPGSYRKVVRQVRDAGMNMLRVGGTMVYEAETFYEECSRQGVLVWQDFMFANMDYPADDARFDASVRVEVAQQAARIANHACLALFCGNSEVEQQAAMWGAPRTAWNPALFHRTIPELLAVHAPAIPYWPSSAHGGAFPHEARRGSASYFGVGAYLRPLEDARRSEVKFASECLAFANVPQQGEPQAGTASATGTAGAAPPAESVRVHHAHWKARVPRDLGAGWDFDDVRDHYLKLLFGVDALGLRYSDHERYLELSRLVPAEIMQAAFGEWRRAQSPCHGALIWFLRDLWPGAGWGIIGADGAPKAPYFWLKRCLQSTALHFSDEGTDGLFLHIANERAAPWRARLELKVYRQSEHVVLEAQRELELAPREPQSVAIAGWLEGFNDLTYAYRFGPLRHDLITAQIVDSPHTALYFPQAPVAVSSDIGLHVEARKPARGEVSLAVSSRAFAYAVYLDVPGYVLDDQYFHVLPGGTQMVRATAVHPSAHPMTGAASAGRGSLRGTARAANCSTVANFRLAT